MLLHLSVWVRSVFHFQSILLLIFHSCYFLRIYFCWSVMGSFSSIILYASQSWDTWVNLRYERAVWTVLQQKVSRSQYIVNRQKVISHKAKTAFETNFLHPPIIWTTPQLSHFFYSVRWKVVNINQGPRLSCCGWNHTNYRITWVTSLDSKASPKL